jgi:hypothetical protein
VDKKAGAPVVEGEGSKGAKEAAKEIAAAERDKRERMREETGRTQGPPRKL